MKTFTYHAHPLSKAGFEQLVENLRAGLITVIDGSSGRKEDWNITLKLDSLDIKSNVEGDDWSLNMPYEDDKVVHVRGMKLEGRDCLIFWRAKLGVAHHALKEFKAILADFFDPAGKSVGFRLHVSNNAFLTGWMVQEKDDHYSLIQLPTWTGPGEGITGRTPYDLEELHVNQSELFINNIWFTLMKDSSDYTVGYDNTEHTFYVIRKFDEPVDINTDNLPYFEINAYEEVNYNSPVMAELGLLPPGQKLPVLVYNDATGRQVAFIEEKFDGYSYDTYVISHGQENITDQITLGPLAAFNEQLIEILIHRYTKLNSEIPDEANVKTIEALEEVKRLQAERYGRRKAIIADAPREEDLPRDAEGTIADLTPAE